MSWHRLFTRALTPECQLYTVPNGAIKMEVLLSNEPALVKAYPLSSHKG